MNRTTVARCALELNLTVEGLLAQLRTAGVQADRPEDELSDKDKRRLLTFLREQRRNKGYWLYDPQFALGDSPHDLDTFLFRLNDLSHPKNGSIETFAKALGVAPVWLRTRLEQAGVSNAAANIGTDELSTLAGWLEYHLSQLDVTPESKWIGGPAKVFSIEELKRNSRADREDFEELLRDNRSDPEPDGRP